MTVMKQYFGSEMTQWAILSFFLLSRMTRYFAWSTKYFQYFFDASKVIWHSFVSFLTKLFLEDIGFMTANVKLLREKGVWFKRVGFKGLKLSEGQLPAGTQVLGEMR